jgi:hypothetical protein
MENKPGALLRVLGYSIKEVITLRVFMLNQ